MIFSSKKSGFNPKCFFPQVAQIIQSLTCRELVLNTYWVFNTLKKYWYWIFNTFWGEVLEKVLILSDLRSNTQYFFQEIFSHFKQKVQNFLPKFNILSNKIWKIKTLLKIIISIQFIQILLWKYHFGPKLPKKKPFSKSKKYWVLIVFQYFQNLGKVLGIGISIQFQWGIEYWAINTFKKYWLIPCS